jgi:hypothetical protein
MAETIRGPFWNAAGLACSRDLNPLVNLAASSRV